jgi:glycosyltransferase involved in cell wall biosynthesis
MKLTMTLLIKNEVDIIADNIKVHSKLGVDSFVVMDNGSTDGTREVLDQLQKEYDLIIIDRPVLDYQQSNWKTEMARVAKAKQGADWVITNDADEFWIPNEGDLKSELTSTGSIIECPRFNVLFDRDAFDNGGKYYNQTNRVQYPINYPKGIQREQENLSIMLGNIHGKVMVRTTGLLRVKGGNHRAWHSWGWLNQKKSQNVSVYHFPIRSKQHFVENIENRQALLAKGVSKMGDHYRRWVDLLNQDKLEEEFERLVVNSEYKSVLQNLGVITQDDKAKNIIKDILEN